MTHTFLQGHGQLDSIYADLSSQCALRCWPLDSIDLLIICGDFQAVRNAQDLNTMAVPPQHRHLGDFHRYYAGPGYARGARHSPAPSTAPVLTLVIGGNHEAAAHMSSLPFGGWLAPQIYYLGPAGVVRYGPLRIAGLSGIFAPSSTRRTRPYHIRPIDVSRLLQLTGPVDIGLSHDWPALVELHGDYHNLYGTRPHWLASAKRDGLGSPAASRILAKLRPRYWFSGHMHYRFSATVDHGGDDGNDDYEHVVRQLPISEDIKAVLPVFKRNTEPAAIPSGNSDNHQTDNKTDRNKETQFLGLSKATSTPNQASHLYMSLLELPPHPLSDEDNALYSSHLGPEGGPILHYDEEWLAIVRASANAEDGNEGLPTPTSVAEHLTWVRENITGNGLLPIPNNFEPNAPAEGDYSLRGRENKMPAEYPSQQTARFRQILGIS